MRLEKLTSLPPTLDLGEYVLRPLRRDDVAAWFSYLSNPEVTGLTSYNIQSVEAVRRMIEVQLEGYAHKRSSRWALAQRDTNKLIGTCGFYWWDQINSKAELAYDLSQEYWGKGLMTQAVQSVLQWGFQTLEINRIQATVMVGNEGSVRVLEKNGFRKEGLLREYKICRGQARDFWMYANIRRGYLAQIKGEKP